MTNINFSQVGVWLGCRGLQLCSYAFFVSGAQMGEQHKGEEHRKVSRTTLTHLEPLGRPGIL